MSDSNAGARRQLKVLALNSGSSSLKVGLYEVGSSRTDTLLSGEVGGIAPGDVTDLDPRNVGKGVQRAGAQAGVRSRHSSRPVTAAGPSPEPACHR